MKTCCDLELKPLNVECSHLNTMKAIPLTKERLIERIKEGSITFNPPIDTEAILNLLQQA